MYILDDPLPVKLNALLILFNLMVALGVHGKGQCDLWLLFNVIFFFLYFRQFLLTFIKIIFK